MSLNQVPVGVTLPHFFEGVEKLLEIWFAESPNEEDDLRNIPRTSWEEMLQLVKCEIISFSKNVAIDAYVLSESSMFVSRRRWILKTCGTTTPLQCLGRLLELAAEHGYNEIIDLFYSRKNFVRPELQVSPHRGFCEEVEFLDSIFPEGRSYCLGSINRECWYLYTFSKHENKKHTEIVPQHSHRLSDPDQTIEILMQNLDSSTMDNFTKDISSDAHDATVRSGVDKILPDMTIDDYLFEPCGYSMNGINQKGEYMTIHITPEKDISYVSFESNVALDNYTGLINQVIKTFQPSKFIVTIFANKSSQAYETMKDLELEYTKVAHWSRTDMQCCNFPSYNLFFAQYSQNT